MRAVNHLCVDPGCGLFTCVFVKDFVLFFFLPGNVSLSLSIQWGSLETLPGPSSLTVPLLGYWILSSLPSPKNSLTVKGEIAVY